MLADIDFPQYELLDLAKLARAHIHSIQEGLFWLAVPLALIPPIPVKWAWIWLRTAAVTLFVWITLMDFRMMYEVRWVGIVLNIEKSDAGYDGVGGNVALLVFGWVFPFLQCLGTLVFMRLFLVRIGVGRSAAVDVVAAKKDGEIPGSNPIGGPESQPVSSGISR